MSEFRDILRVQGVKAKGFGIIPKMVMLDRKITIEAKAIYGYFCSYAGAGDTAFPSRDKICDDLCVGKDRYYKHFNLLIEYGYVEVEQIRTDGGKFKHNIYTLIDKPEPKPVDNLEEKSSEDIDIPCTENKDTDKNNENTDSQPCPQNQYTDNRDTENKDINNNSLLYNQQSSLKGTVSQSKETDETDLLNQITQQAQIDIYYEDSRDLLVAAINKLLNMKSITISDKLMKGEEIKSKLMGLKMEMCDLALNKYACAIRDGRPIKNKMQYFCTILMNSIEEYRAEDYYK